MPFGTEVNWEVFRQMQADEAEIIDDLLVFSKVILTMISILFLLLVLTCGPLLPFWMFLNSLQLLVHTPLIKANIPGNAHYFFLDYLNILRLHFWSLNLWLQELAGANKEFDSAMVENETAEHYSALIYTCGYSFSFLPNLILIVCLFIVILIIWLLLLSRDLCSQEKARKRSSSSCI